MFRSSCTVESNCVGRLLGVMGLFTVSQVYQRLEFFRWGLAGATDMTLGEAIARPLVMAGVEISVVVCFDFGARGITNVGMSADGFIGICRIAVTWERN